MLFKSKIGYTIKSVHKNSKWTGSGFNRCETYNATPVDTALAWLYTEGKNLNVDIEICKVGDYLERQVEAKIKLIGRKKKIQQLVTSFAIIKSDDFIIEKTKWLD